VADSFATSYDDRILGTVDVSLTLRTHNPPVKDDWWDVREVLRLHEF
jgi:hypothetical protein